MSHVTASFSAANGKTVLAAHLFFLLVTAWMLAGASALYQSEEERDEWLERMHHEERDHIYRSLNEGEGSRNEGEGTVDIIVHFRENCPSHPEHYYLYTTGEPMTVPIEEYEYMYRNKERLCILMIELDTIATEATFVTGANDMDTSGFDLANTEFETWGIRDLLGDFPIDRSDEFLASRDRVKVCFIDSGVQADHPDFPWGNMNHPFLQGKEFDVEDDRWYVTHNGGWHGTHVTGCACATAGNNKGTMGVIPDCAKYLDAYIARVFTNAHSATTKMSNVDSAIEWCSKEMGAQIISLSLSSNKYSYNSDRILEEIKDKTLVIAAAGNGGSDAGYSYPAHYPSAMSVGSIGPDYLISDFSQKGADVLAMGEGILAPSTANGIENIGQSRGQQVDPIIFSPVTDDPVTGPICDAGCADGIFACAQSESICLFDRCTGIPVTDQVGNAELAKCVGCVVSADSPQALYSDGPNFSFEGSIPCVYVDSASAQGLRASASSANDVAINFAYPNYKFADGTSQSTPFVSGAAALLMHERPGCSPQQIRNAIENSARNLRPEGGDPELYGKGFVQAGLALKLLEQEPGPCGDGPTTSPTRSPSLRPTNNPTVSPTTQPTSAPTEDLEAMLRNSATSAPTNEPTTPIVLTRRNPNYSVGFNERWKSGYRERGRSGNY